MSLATYSNLYDQRTVEAGVRGLFKICQNCARNFFRCVQSSSDSDIRSGETLCCKCKTVSTTSGNQLWTCARCGTFRSYGEGRPGDTAAKFLRCDHCADVREHEFWKVA